MHCGDKPAAEPGKSYDLRTAPRLITRRAALASGRVSLIIIGELRSTRDTGMFEMNVSIVQRVDRIHSKRVRGGAHICTRIQKSASDTRWIYSIIINFVS